MEFGANLKITNLLSRYCWNFEMWWQTDIKVDTRLVYEVWRSNSTQNNTKVHTQRLFHFLRCRFKWSVHLTLPKENMTNYFSYSKIPWCVEPHPINFSDKWQIYECALERHRISRGILFVVLDHLTNIGWRHILSQFAGLYVAAAAAVYLSGSTSGARAQFAANWEENNLQLFSGHPGTVVAAQGKARTQTSVGSRYKGFSTSASQLIWYMYLYGDQCQTVKQMFTWFYNYVICTRW